MELEPSPTKVTTTTEIVDGVTRVINTITGTTISTICVIAFCHPSQQNNGLQGDDQHWGQPVQDKIDAFTVEGTSNFIGVINDQNERIWSLKFPTLESMQLGMEKLARKYGFCVPKFDAPTMDDVDVLNHGS